MKEKMILEIEGKIESQKFEQDDVKAKIIQIFRERISFGSKKNLRLLISCKNNDTTYPNSGASSSFI